MYCIYIQKCYAIWKKKCVLTSYLFNICERKAATSRTYQNMSKHASQLIGRKSIKLIIVTKNISDFRKENNDYRLFIFLFFLLVHCQKINMNNLPNLLQDFSEQCLPK